MKYTIIASGSKGNCLLIESGNTRIAIDCGYLKRYTQAALKQIGIENITEQINGVLVTHQHSDHVKSLDIFRDVPVYSEKVIGINHIVPYQSFKIGCLTITPLRLSHDEPSIGYVINDGEETLVQMTDTGYVSAQNEAYITNAEYYIFESNHDCELLRKSSRPDHLIRRILGDYGHLCNEDSANCLRKVVGDRTKEVVLAHISEECNAPGLPTKVLKETFDEYGVDYSYFRIIEAKQKYNLDEIFQGGD